ncbi:MAG: radical SAM protein [Betaproteobacteria bacterium]|nr:radical SAM protein [Betaproteobacteria bacterium]
MNSNLLAKSVRNLRNAVAININHARGREFIPKKRDCLSIETSSICNLKCCFCAYPKKQSAKVVMDDRFFQSCIAQAVELGYDKFDLTPCTGDVFMDRTFLNKLDHLEQHPGVVSYSFHTNFTIPRRKDIERLAQFRKIEGLNISIYGYDSGTFVAITKSPEKLYRRLVHNLELLFELMKDRALPVHFSFHTGAKSIRGQSSAMIDVLEKFRKAGTAVKASKNVYNNWGGYITQQDVKGLPITVVGPDLIYKKGACVRLFTTIQIMATGIVNGCACRDADATLRLGDLHEKPLGEIVSSRNPAYMALIEEQQNGEFRPVCRSCDYYASIYHKSSVYGKNGTELQSLEEFRSSLP